MSTAAIMQPNQAYPSVADCLNTFLNPSIVNHANHSETKVRPKSRSSILPRVSSAQSDRAMFNHPVRLVIADDHPVVLCGLISLLGSKPPFTIVASCSSGTECISTLRKLQPDVALLDMSMPDVNGLQILDIVKAEELPTRIVFYSASMADRDLTAAAARGVHGILFKDCSPDALLHGLREVANGGRCLPIPLIDDALEREAQREDRSAAFSSLTDREYKAVLLVSAALSNKQIAHQLRVCEGTVKLHLHNVYGKLEVANRTALAALCIAGAWRNGL
jgi:two-component system nitrate/nitrite response regulator NarL